MGPIGVPEMIFIFVLALLIFGPRKLPELGRSLGRAMTEFRRASSDLRRTVEAEMHELERQSHEAVKPLTESIGTGPVAIEQPPDAPPADAGREKSGDASS